MQLLRACEYLSPRVPVRLGGELLGKLIIYGLDDLQHGNGADEGSNYGLRAARFTSSTPLEGHIPIAFPEGFSSIINEDLNGSFFCDYISSEDDDDNIVRHVSWTCFKVKMVLKPNVYEWIQTALLIDWTASTDSQIVLVLNLPEKQQLQIQRKLSQIKARVNPFQWHMEFTSTLITLYDESIWLLRDLVRVFEKSSNKPNLLPPNFPHPHDIGRHIFHSTETLEIAGNTVANIIAEQARWRDKSPKSRQKGRDA
ncbi:uncharacterized protein LDX57_003641 [Aspergillus melleus]|uniref:uncharacterized protein n=1 Tax=Aspergillus melleus TaxID=138277 RepID=UPI001E8E49FE|nr:uncharacterized protein LDX57_003641 [Aspergillus melleus]KAH8425900.1 hypothetical protein LDX57_003641 [Aspergillus melleus]